MFTKYCVIFRDVMRHARRHIRENIINGKTQYYVELKRMIGLHRIFLFILISLVAGCTHPIEPITSNEMSSDEYAVLRAIADSFHVASRYSVIVLLDTTTTGVTDIDSDLARTQRHIPDLRSDAMTDFINKAQHPLVISTPTMICSNCILESVAHQENIHFPFLEVSRVGFSSDHKQALAYMGFQPAPLSGTGNYYVLSKVNGKWIIIGMYMVWIS